MQKLTVFVTLSSSGMGEATEDDYNSYVDFASEKLDEYLPEYAPVDVDSYNFGDSKDTDILISGPHNDEDPLNDGIRENVQEALIRVWEAWCGGK